MPIYRAETLIQNRQSATLLFADWRVVRPVHCGFVKVNTLKYRHCTAAVICTTSSIDIGAKECTKPLCIETNKARRHITLQTKSTSQLAKGEENKKKEKKIQPTFSKLCNTALVLFNL